MTTLSRYSKSMIIFLILAVFLPGCRPGIMPADIDMKARQIVPPPGKALVYVYTISKYEAKVYCSGMYIGRLGKDRYIYSILDPGIYDFGRYSDARYQFRIEIKGDETYYIELHSEDGYVAPSFDFFRVKDNVARSKMERCGLSMDLGNMLE